MSRQAPISPLVRIRSERDRMSAIERRVADFLVENARLLRDYSSQQLADALGISQSSVVKFSQKLGYRGYPDLKYCIGESLARDEHDDREPDDEPAALEDENARHSAMAEALWKAKTRAVAESRALNPPGKIEPIASAIRDAQKVFAIGLGLDGIHARAFTSQLSLMGLLAVHYFDPVLMPAGVSSAGKDDVLIVFSEQGKQSSLCRLAQLFRDRHGKVVTVTRHNANPLRAYADMPLLVAAHDTCAHVQPLVYQAAVMHLLDVIVLLLCEDPSRATQLETNLERIKPMLDT